jgi:hypothetical protein
MWKDSFEFWYQHDVLGDGDWTVAEIEVKVHLEVEFDGDYPYDWVIERMEFQGHRYDKKAMKYEHKMIPITKDHPLYEAIAAGVYEVALDKISDAISDGEIGVTKYNAMVAEDRYDRQRETEN